MPIGTYHFAVEGQRAGFNNKLKLSGLGDILQCAAWKHAMDLGFGLEEMINNHRRTWAISRYQIDIDYYPSYSKELKVKTWPKNKDRFFAYRDLIVESEGNVLARCTSSYALIDLDTRRPVSLDHFTDDILDHKDYHAIEEHAKKVAPFIGETEKNIKAELTDLDVNKHVNNIRYLDWSENMMPLSFWETHEIFRAEVNFYSEIKYADNIKLESQHHDGFLLVSGEVNDKIAFRTRLSFRKI